jgi:proteic killer suppression protein
MIVSFRDKATEDLYHGRKTKEVRRFPADIITTSLRKLDLLNAAADLRDLRSPPGNRLKALSGDLKGFHSIRVNDQWRIIFQWEEKNAHNVMLTDYHA